MFITIYLLILIIPICSLAILLATNEIAMVEFVGQIATCIYATPAPPFVRTRFRDFEMLHASTNTLFQFPGLLLFVKPFVYGRSP